MKGFINHLHTFADRTWEWLAERKRWDCVKDHHGEAFDIWEGVGDAT